MSESRGSRQACCELFVDIDDEDWEDISELVVTNKSIERLMGLIAARERLVDDICGSLRLSLLFVRW